MKCQSCGVKKKNHGAAKSHRLSVMLPSNKSPSKRNFRKSWSSGAKTVPNTTVARTVTKPVAIPEAKPEVKTKAKIKAKEHTVCSKCQKPTEGKFCAECGGKVVAKQTPTPREQTCTSCSAQLPAKTKFCLQCGTKVGGSRAIRTTVAASKQVAKPLPTNTAAPTVSFPRIASLYDIFAAVNESSKLRRVFTKFKIKTKLKGLRRKVTDDKESVEVEKKALVAAEAPSPDDFVCSNCNHRGGKVNQKFCMNCGNKFVSLSAKNKAGKLKVIHDRLAAARCRLKEHEEGVIEKEGWLQVIDKNFKRTIPEDKYGGFVFEEEQAARMSIIVTSSSSYQLPPAHDKLARLSYSSLAKAPPNTKPKTKPKSKPWSKPKPKKVSFSESIPNPPSSVSSSGSAMSTASGKFKPAPPPSRPKSQRPTSAMLYWVQSVLQGYNGVLVKGLGKKSWKNGLAFAALTMQYRPGLVDMKLVFPKHPVPTNTLKVAFDAAEQAGVCALLDAEDVEYADRKSIFTQLTIYHKEFSQVQADPRGIQKWNEALC